MKLKIGQNIKTLRKAREVTQEDLAEILGVSCQSVSRWELGTCYPDMELLPVMAAFFEVSVDDLLGTDNAREEAAVKDYLDRFQLAISCGKIDECIEIARAGVAEFPGNFALQNKLMYALFVSGDDTGNIPNWKENMEKYDREIVSLGEKIIRFCPDQEIRLEATARLAFQHCEMGRKKEGRAIYETLPTHDSYRERHIWWALEEEEKPAFLLEEVERTYRDLDSMIWLLGSSGVLPAADAIRVFEKIEALEALMYDGARPKNGWGDAKLPFKKACLYAKLGESEKAMACLWESARAAKAFDARPEEQRYRTLLMGEQVERRVDFETADTRPLAEILRDSWLADSALDNLRKEKAFCELMEYLA